MRGTRCLFSLAVLAVWLCITVLPAQAWEFELAGTFNWYYEYYSQAGSKGFFGPYNVDNGAGATRAANLNFWNGGRFDTNTVTGSQADWSYFNVEFLPKFKLNPAIQFRGKYRLGTFGIPLAPDYHTFDLPGMNNAFTDGQWTMFWATAQLPIGVFGIGKRPWTFGTGLQYDGEDGLTTESMTLVAPYGPLDVGIAFYPYRFAGSSSVKEFDQYNYFLGAVAPFNALDLPTYKTPAGNTQGQYFSRADSSGSMAKDFLLFLNYHSGPLNMGVLGSFMSYHIGPEALLQNPADPYATSPLVAVNSDLFHGTAYMKYNNGRFFLNAEGAWIYWDDRFGSESTPTATIGTPHTRYTQQWRYMVEMGAICGPAKISLLNAWTPGPDRRAGILIDRQPATFVWHPTFDRMHGNFDVFRPYSYLFLVCLWRRPGSLQLEQRRLFEGRFRAGGSS